MSWYEPKLGQQIGTNQNLHYFFNLEGEEQSNRDQSTTSNKRKKNHSPPPDKKLKKNDQKSKSMMPTSKKPKKLIKIKTKKNKPQPTNKNNFI